MSPSVALNQRLRHPSFLTKLTQQTGLRHLIKTHHIVPDRPSILLAQSPSDLKGNLALMYNRRGIK